MNKNERHEYIIECAKKLFVSKGYHNTTVGDIIEECRIVRSTFYSHFKSKIEIFHILVDRFSEILLRAILGINISRARRDMDLAQQIREMSAALVEAIDANRDLARLLITASLGHDNEFDNRVSAFYHTILRAIKQLFVEGIEGKNVKDLDPDLMSYFVLGGIKQLLIQWLLYDEVQDVHELLDDIVHCILHGIVQSENGEQ